MSLRVKLAIAMVALAAIATISVGSVSYFSTSHTLRREVDASLNAAARQLFPGPGGVAGAPGPDGQLVPPARDGDGDGDRDGVGRFRNFTQILVQVIDRDGTVLRAPASGALPVSKRDLAVAAGASRRGSLRHDVSIDGEPYRMLTVQTSDGAVQFARSLGETERLLGNIRNSTLIIVLVASVVALVVGVVIAEHVTRRLVRLTEVATAVATSGDLDIEVPVEGNDETGRLAQAFNRMLASLASSRRAQHQLVQDAGHELRTPLTSLRTNVTVMQRYDDLSPASRQRLLADLESETRELTELVNEIVELATDQRDLEVESTVSLGEIAEVVAERARRRSDREITVSHDGSQAIGRPQAIERAVNNLVANALKFSDGPVEVSVQQGRIAVSDRGPGLGDIDRAKMFDRFYRSDAARALPGSGLGLAIVRETALQHGGSVFADDRPGGGATIGFTVPNDRVRNPTV